MITVWGRAAAPDTLAAKYHQRTGQLLEAHAWNQLDLTLPDDGITITADHDSAVPLGRLVHAELADDGALHAVGVVDDRLAEYEGDMFWSAELEMRGSAAAFSRSVYVANSASLIGLSITANPASLAAIPLNQLAGDIRSSADRHVWPLSWKQLSLLQRAADVHQRPADRNRSASHIVERRKRVEDAYDERPSGPLRYRPGKILSVH